MSEDVKLEQMETGDAPPSEVSEEACEPKKPRPIRRFEVLALAQVLASFLVAARVKSNCRVDLHAIDACSMAWRCRFLTARPSHCVIWI